METTSIIIGIVSIPVGLVLGYFTTQLIIKGKIQNMMKKAEIEGEKIKDHKILQAKERFMELKMKHDSSKVEREKEILEKEKRLKNKEITINQTIENSRRKEKEYNQKLEHVNKKNEVLDNKTKQLEKNHAEIVKMLESVSNYSSSEAKNELVKTLKEEAKTAASSYIQQSMEEARLNAKTEAQKIIIQTIQRIGTEVAIENTVSVFNIESDEVKGRIIGREGRNIRTLESCTGVEIIVDDTPEAIVLSCFDPVRREIARLALHKLVVDGRIHPARIEEVVKSVKREIDEEIIFTGKKTTIDLGIHGLHPELIKIVGRMKYRSSYGQNLLQHSREVANLCSLMATELGLDKKMAKRAGLLHDIGKVPESENETPHAILGMQWAQKYGEKPEVCNAIGAHHDEIAMTSILSPIIQVCDAISGARPGVRRQSMESYIQRLKDLEEIALSKNGVSSAYAIQAGRDLRVIVENENITEAGIEQLSNEISKDIQEKLTYPGQIRVTVIRETRAISVAK